MAQRKKAPSWTYLTVVIVQHWPRYRPTQKEKKIVSSLTARWQRPADWWHPNEIQSLSIAFQRQQQNDSTRLRKRIDDSTIAPRRFHWSTLTTTTTTTTKREQLKKKELNYKVPVGRTPKKSRNETPQTNIDEPIKNEVNPIRRRTGQKKKQIKQKKKEESQRNSRKDHSGRDAGGHYVDRAAPYLMRSDRLRWNFERETSISRRAKKKNFFSFFFFFLSAAPAHTFCFRRNTPLAPRRHRSK